MSPRAVTPHAVTDVLWECEGQGGWVAGKAGKVQRDSA